MSANFSITRSRTAIFDITVTQGGAALDLTGKTLTCTAKQALGGPSVFEKDSNSNGITITDASGGVASMEIAPGDTVSLPDVLQTPLFYDLVLTDGAREWTLQSGQLLVAGNVT